MTAEEFIEQNPEIWGEFCKVAAQLIARGHARHSADGIFHIIRWQRAVELNNDWTSTFARRWLAENPQHPRFFELRSAAVAVDDRQAEMAFA